MAPSRAAWEGFGPDDPHSGRARGEPEPPADDPWSEYVNAGPPTAADNRHFRSQARAQNPPRSSGPRSSSRSESTPAGSSSPRRDPERVKPSAVLGPASGRRSGGGFSFSSTVDTASSGLVAVFAYALVLNYLRYGWPGVTGWFSAKFINKVTVGGTTTKGTSNVGPSTSTSPGDGTPAPKNVSPAPGQPGNPNAITGGTTANPNLQSGVLTP